MTPEDLCPCGSPTESAYYWHQTSHCECMHHDAALCRECTTTRLAVAMISEIEQHLAKVA